jgi:hypothetical protein
MALLGAARSIRAGDHNRTNRMFRARIYAQGFTLVAMVVGSMYWKTDRQKRKEFDAIVAERKAKEKNEAWIRELEARDEEERQLRAEREKRRGRGAVAASKGTAVKRAAGNEAAGKGGGVAGTASSMVDERERRKGTLEMVNELVYGTK